MGSGRCTHHHRKLLWWPLSNWLTATCGQNILNQEVERCPFIEANGRQWRNTELGQRNIITADHGDRLWHPDASVREGCHDCKGHLVIVATHPKGQSLLREQFRDGFP